MQQRWTAAGLALATLATGCGKLGCCNSCSRDYYLAEGDDRWATRISSAGEAGDECAIDEVPRSYEDGPHTLLVEVMAADDGGATEVHTRGVLTGEHADCADGEPAQPRSALAEASVGDTLCVVADVTSETLCTEMACAGT